MQRNSMCLFLINVNAITQCNQIHIHKNITSEITQVVERTVIG